MRLTAIVLHQVGPDMFFKYDPKTSTLYHAHTFQVEADNIEKAADLIWILTNVGSSEDLWIEKTDLSAYGDQVDAYRARKNRSLSVGDVIMFMEGERPAGAVAVESVGFKAIQAQHALEFLSERAQIQATLSEALVNSSEFSDSFHAHERKAREPGSRLIMGSPGSE